MKNRKKKPMDENEVKIIKISREALFEFIYEQIIDKQEKYFDVDPLDVTNTFYMDWDQGQFIFCVYKTEDNEENINKLPKEIDLIKLMKNMSDTTDSMYADNRYRQFTKQELVELSK